MTEYWLQKKTLGGWSHVTWYGTEAEAIKTFEGVSAGNSGYSWRVVKAESFLEKMLEEVVQVEASKQEPLKPKSGWIEPRQPSQDQKSGWGATPTAGWGNPIKSISTSPDGELSVGDGRGAKPGSVCLMHHNLKKRMRAMPEELDGLLSQGWERGGPRTQFRQEG